MNINQVLFDLRNWIDSGGNPEPSRRLAFPNPNTTLPANRRLDEQYREQLKEVTDSMVVLVEGWQSPTERDKKVLSVLRNFAATFRNTSAIVTPMDALNCIGWWNYLCIWEPDKRNESVERLIDGFLAPILTEHLEYVHLFAVSIKQRDLVPVSTPISSDQMNQSYRDLLELSMQVSFAPQVLNESQAIRLFGDLSGCDVIARTLADGLYLLHGIQPVLVAVHRAMRMNDLFDLALTRSAEDARAAIRSRVERLQMMVADVPSDAVLFQFAEASEKLPYRNELIFLHSLYHFAEPFVHLQRRTADPAVGKLFGHRLNSFTSFLLAYSSDDLRRTAEQVRDCSENTTQSQYLPFGYMYHLTEALRRHGGRKGESSFEMIETLCSNGQDRLLKCRQSELHRFCQSVASEMSERWGYRIGELYWIKVGFIASNDFVDDELQEIGGLDDAINEPTEHSDIAHYTNPASKKVESGRKKSAAKRPKFVFDEEYARWSGGEEPSEDKLLPIMQRADEYVAEISKPLGTLRGKLVRSLGGIPCPSIENALVGRLIVFWTALRYPSRAAAQVVLGHPLQSETNVGINKRKSESGKVKQPDTGEYFRDGLRGWGLTDFRFETAKEFSGWKKYEHDFVNDRP